VKNEFSLARYHWRSRYFPANIPGAAIESGEVTT
jgi:hypothetical protein